MIEGESEKEIKQGQSNHIDKETEIDLMDVLRKIIAIRKTIYKAAGIGLVIGVIIAICIPKQYTAEVTLSPEMGSNKGGGLSGLAASFLGSDVAMGDGTDALNASLSADIVSSTPFLLELSLTNVIKTGFPHSTPTIPQEIVIEFTLPSAFPVISTPFFTPFKISPICSKTSIFFFMILFSSC